MNKPKLSSGYFLPLVFVSVMFFCIGFSLGINGLLIPYLKKAFSLSSADSYLVIAAAFSAFVVFGYPAGLLIQKVGYKRGMSLSFVIFSIGLALFIPSARLESFPLFLLASFVSGAGNTLLQAAVNPYVTICGPMESAARRISIMTIINRSGWAIAPIFLAMFLDISQVTVSLQDMLMPFYIIVGVFMMLGVLAWFAPLPEIKAKGEENGQETEESADLIAFVASKKSILQFPHLLLGVLTLFFYVGLDTLIFVTPVDFASTLGLANPQVYTMHTVYAISVGCILGILLIPKIISQTTALKVCAILGCVTSLLIVLMPPQISLHLVSLLGFSSSMVWPAVWPLAISYLGKYTKVGSSLLVIAVVGGAIIPLLFGWLKDLTSNIQQAYWILLPSFLIITFYAFKGHKIGLKAVNLLRN